MIILAVFCYTAGSDKQESSSGTSGSSVEAWCPTQHIIGHFGDDFYMSYDQTNSVKAQRKTSWSFRNKAWIPPAPLHHVTIIQL